MSKIIKISGDLLDIKSQMNIPNLVIAHQCNCKTTYGIGLYDSIAERYPYADIYSQQIDRTPGDVIISMSSQQSDLMDDFSYPKRPIPSGEGNPVVISMLAQINPGKPRKSPDSAKDRIKYFTDCLRKMTDLPYDAIAFPHNPISNEIDLSSRKVNIGCGLAGGKWTDYEKLIRDFAEYSGKTVIIAKL